MIKSENIIRIKRKIVANCLFFPQWCPSNFSLKITLKNVEINIFLLLFLASFDSKLTIQESIELINFVKKKIKSKPCDGIAQFNILCIFFTHFTFRVAEIDSKIHFFLCPIKTKTTTCTSTPRANNTQKYSSRSNKTSILARNIALRCNFNDRK